MKKVYVVTSGHYSDYGIEAVFLNKKEAEKYVERMNNINSEYDKCKIEIWDTGISKDSEYYNKYFEVIMYRKVKVYTRSCLAPGKTQFVDTNYNSNANEKCYLKHSVKTDDRKTAIKVTNELRTMLLANNIWGDNDRLNEFLGTKKE